MRACYMFISYPLSFQQGGGRLLPGPDQWLSDNYCPTPAHLWAKRGSHSCPGADHGPWRLHCSHGQVCQLRLRTRNKGSCGPGRRWGLGGSEARLRAYLALTLALSSLNRPFGSGLITPSGILLNSQMLDFSWPNRTANHPAPSLVGSCFPPPLGLWGEVGGVVVWLLLPPYFWEITV